MSDLRMEIVEPLEVQLIKTKVALAVEKLKAFEKDLVVKRIFRKQETKVHSSFIEILNYLEETSK